MSRSCCGGEKAVDKPGYCGSRWLDAVGWLVPATVLALMPKCPMCVVAYAALFTGLGLSLSAATAIRTTLIVLSAASLAYMGWRTSMRAVRIK